MSSPGSPEAAPRGPLAAFAGWLDRWLGRAEHVFLWAACSCTAVMLVLNIANLLVRNITGRGIVWVWAWTGVLFVWSVFLAFFVLYRRNLDVTLDFFVARLSERAQLGVRILTAFCGITMMVVILWQTPQFFQRQVGVLDFVGLQRYVLSIPLIAASAGILLHFIVDLLLVNQRGARPTAAEEIPKWSL